MRFGTKSGLVLRRWGRIAGVAFRPREIAPQEQIEPVNSSDALVAVQLGARAADAFGQQI